MEGLPVFLERCRMVEHAQREVMTGLLYRAVNEHGAGIVIPLDVDEFLVNTENHVEVRKILGQLDSGKVYSLPWRFYEPADEKRGIFLLSRKCKRNARNDPSTGKVIVGGEAVRSMALSLAQGNHSVASPIGKVEMHVIPHLHIAHYHFLGQSEYLCKCMVGWLNTVAKYTKFTLNGIHWETAVQAVLGGNEEIYQPGEYDKVEEQCDLRQYCSEQVLRYTNKEEPSWLRYFMMASLDLAEIYAEQKMFQRNIIISIMVPFCGDATSLGKTMESIRVQTYPASLIEIVILDFYGNGEMIQKNVQGMQGYSSVKLIHCVNQSNLSELIGKTVSGTYCQWLLPGDCLLADKLAKMLTIMESHEIRTLLLADSERKIEAMSPWFHIVHPEGNRFFFASTTWLWKQCMALEKYPYGGIAAVLVHRNIVEQCQWFVSCFQGNVIQQMKIWEMLLGKVEQCMVMKEDFLEA